MYYLSELLKQLFIPVFFCSGKGAVLGSLTNSQSVSFRQGTNVEFGPNAFNNGPVQGVCTKKLTKRLFNLS